MTQFQTLDATVESPALKAVFSHWCQARGDRLMPAWRDIDAAAIGKYLPMVWAWRFDFALGTFIGRLAGEEILAVLGTGVRGRPLEQCHAPDAAKVMIERYKMVMAGPRIMHSTGQVYVRIGRHSTGERIVLPLADDGVNGDGVIGATEYHLNIGAPKRVGAAVQQHHDNIKYFPVTDGG